MKVHFTVAESEKMLEELRLHGRLSDDISDYHPASFTDELPASPRAGESVIILEDDLGSFEQESGDLQAGAYLVKSVGYGKHSGKWRVDVTLEFLFTEAELLATYPPKRNY